MKLAVKILLVFLLLITGVVLFQLPKLNIISGYAAKYMASGVHLADRTPADIIHQDYDVPLIKWADAELVEQGGKAKASVFGLAERYALCRDGLGCVLFNKDFEPKNNWLTPKRNIKADTLEYPIGSQEPRDTVFPEINYQQLEEAVAHAFHENDTQRTRTLLILYKDKIIAERYAEGFDKNTPILGWSMTKSILATLYGILQEKGVLHIKDPAPVREWQRDERSQISLRDLLQMQSGLEWEEDYSKISDVTEMLFFDADMSRAQREKELKATPGTHWNYSSGTSNLLSAILKNYFDSEQEYLDFPYSALIDKIGMNSMLMETDWEGNYVGSSYAWANTRDWGKFGLLYLHRGEWNGERLFNPSWVDFVTSPVEDSAGQYGGHFWLNQGNTYPNAPSDLYSANGYQGQHVYIIPSKELVIVRTGLAETPEFDADGFFKSLLQAF
ncbi:MAG: serine hydrolase [Flavobacteriaceae bacterium]|nr:serine hydrolase [Flavobacteriaceae bacterium]